MPIEPNHKSLQETARRLVQAELPLCFTNRLGGKDSAFEALSELARVLALPGEDRERAVRAWQLALGRLPRESELALAMGHIDGQRRHFARGKPGPEAESLAWASLCHVLVNTNEFIYVD